MSKGVHNHAGGSGPAPDTAWTVHRLMLQARHFAALCRDGNLVMLNANALAILGHPDAPADTFAGLHFSSLAHSDDAWALGSWWPQASGSALSQSQTGLGGRRYARIGSAKTGWHHLELTCAIHLIDGEKYEIILGRPVEKSVLIMPDDMPAPPQPGVGVNVLRRERVKRKWAERSVRRLAYQDHLTGLINRAYYQLRLKNGLRKAAKHENSLALLFVDIDRFKEVNEFLGNAAGDQLLKHIADRLKHCVRVTDTVARLGGDEFAIIVNHLSERSDVTTLAEKIISTLAQPFTLGDRNVHIGACIGATIYPEDAQDAEFLQKNADAALRNAKHQGAGHFQIYHPQMNAETQQRKQLEEELRHAIYNNQLVVHYQPKINSATGAVSGIEALVRWQHPERGMIPPLMFIHIAEATNLILPLTESVLRTSCTDLKMCHDMGLKIGHVSVNLSANLIQQDDLAGVVKRILDETALPANHLELEITESIMMEDIDRARSVLNSIYLLGVALSLDDFGTGYSSLTYLRQFPIRTLKIDRSFITDMTESSEDIAIIRAVIALAHSLEYDQSTSFCWCGDQRLCQALRTVSAGS